MGRGLLSSLPANGSLTNGRQCRQAGKQTATVQTDRQTQTPLFHLKILMSGRQLVGCLERAGSIYHCLLPALPACPLVPILAAAVTAAAPLLSCSVCPVCLGNYCHAFNYRSPLAFQLSTSPLCLFPSPLHKFIILALARLNANCDFRQLIETFSLLHIHTQSTLRIRNALACSLLTSLTCATLSLGA